MFHVLPPPPHNFLTISCSNANFLAAVGVYLWNQRQLTLWFGGQKDLYILCAWFISTSNPVPNLGMRRLIPIGVSSLPRLDICYE